jgi:hypothetical protein
MKLLHRRLAGRPRAEANDRGRNGDCSPPPAQTRTGPIRASCTFPARFQKGGGAVARGVERSETTRATARATARTALSFWTEPIRREQPPHPAPQAIASA